MTRNDCQNMASIGQYVAGNGQTYPVSLNVRREISHFAIGTATAFTIFYRSQIACTGGLLMVDGVEIYNMVLYVTEEILFRKEKFISRDDEDGVIAHFDNMRLTCPIEDSFLKLTIALCITS